MQQFREKENQKQEGNSLKNAESDNMQQGEVFFIECIPIPFCLGPTAEEEPDQNKQIYMHMVQTV